MSDVTDPNGQAAQEPTREPEPQLTQPTVPVPDSPVHEPSPSEPSPAEPSPPEPSPPEPAARRRRWPRRAVVAVLFIVGLAAIGGGAAGLVAQANAAAARHPTQAEITAAGNREFALQWRRLTAGQIFPATVTYIDGLGTKLTATRVGIAPQAPCAAAFDPKVAKVMAAAGCVTVLRATYTDDTRTAVATIGVAVVRSAAASTNAVAELSSSSLGYLIPVSFPGTIASKFTRSAVGIAGYVAISGPYVAFYVAGSADGRAAGQSSQIQYGAYTDVYQGQYDLATSVVRQVVAGPFAQLLDPCADRYVQC